jgi:hypothetical protein
MNRLRLRYALLSLVFLGLALTLAYGLVEVDDPLVTELSILAGVVVLLMCLMGRDSEREDETAGIVSLDDDD